MPKELKWIERELPLAELIFSDDLKVREPDMATVDIYARNYASGETLPPLKAAQIGKALYLVDGWHRALAARKAGLVALPVLTARMTQPQASAEAALANAKHGRGISKGKETDRALEMYFRDPANLNKSARAVSVQLGGHVSKSTVNRMQQKLKADEAPPQSAWDSERAAEAKQERLEQDAKAALKTLETHWGRLTDPQTKRWILQLAEETVGRLSGDAAKLPKSPLDI